MEPSSGRSGRIRDIQTRKVVSQKLVGLEQGRGKRVLSLFDCVEYKALSISLVLLIGYVGPKASAFRANASMEIRSSSLASVTNLILRAKDFQVPHLK